VSNTSGAIANLIMCVVQIYLALIRQKSSYPSNTTLAAPDTKASTALGPGELGGVSEQDISLFYANFQGFCNPKRNA
jgi:hypothetical protein